MPSTFVASSPRRAIHCVVGDGAAQVGDAGLDVDRHVALGRGGGAEDLGLDLAGEAVTSSTSPVGAAVAAAPMLGGAVARGALGLAGGVLRVAAYARAAGVAEVLGGAGCGAGTEEENEKTLHTNRLPER